MKTSTVMALLALVLFAACAAPPADLAEDQPVDAVEDVVGDVPGSTVEVSDDELADLEEELNELEQIEELELGDLENLEGDLDQI